jgi:hypothetical protein
MSSLTNPKLIKRAMLFLLFLVLLCPSFASSSFPNETTDNIERAKTCFEEYIKTLQGGSEEEAKKFWNKEETERYKMYDWQWGYLSFRKLNLFYLNYKIINAEERDGYVILQVEWYYREGKAGPLQKDIRYFIEEDGRMVGANPIFVYTRGWLQKSSRHFVYHFKHKQDEPNSALLEKMDRFYEKVVDFLKVNDKDKIDYFKCDSTNEVGRFFEMEPSLARSQVINRVIVSMQNFVPHEIVHVISYRIFPQDEIRMPSRILDEGLSYYLGGASFFSSDLLLSWAKKILKEDENIKIDSLIRDPWIYGSNESAGLVSSFVKFLIDTRGVDKFKQLFVASGNSEEQSEATKEIYGKSMEQLQEEWKEFVLALDLPEVKIVSPTGGRELFHIVDPLGDDKGDGDYTYPKNERALPGIFDLTGFKISLDDEMVYFQLQFVNLSDEEIRSDTAFNGTFTAIAIDSDDKEGSGNTQLFFGNGNFEFSKKDAYEYVIEVSNAGILVYDQDWVWHLLFLSSGPMGKADAQQNHIRGNEISFAIPQKIIGTPDSSWKIQVLTGGQKGGFKNTAYGVGKFMKVSEESTSDQGGDGTDTDFNPDVYDILTSKGQDQVQILSNYNVAKKRKAVIPMINLKQR